MAQIRIWRRGEDLPTTRGVSPRSVYVWVLHDRGCSLQVWSVTAADLADAHRVRAQAETLSRVYPSLRVDALVDAVRGVVRGQSREVVIELGESEEARQASARR